MARVKAQVKACPTWVRSYFVEIRGNDHDNDRRQRKEGSLQHTINVLVTIVYEFAFIQATLSSLPSSK